MSELLEAYRRVRGATRGIVEPLEPEDCCIQSMPDVSPIKWHLAHTTWFFEQFALRGFEPGFREEHPAYAVLFNSYYNAVGPQHCRTRRGALSRPTVREVMAYRASVDRRVEAMLTREPVSEALRSVVTLGVHHEQQHQELMVTDLKHVLSSNPLMPVYHTRDPDGGREDAADDPVLGGAYEPPIWRGFDGGVVSIGRPGDAAGFAFDNEAPRHRVFLEPFALAAGKVTNRGFAAFIADGGYQRPELWLSAGWATVQREGWDRPLYWYREQEGGPWMEFSLAGPRPIRARAPVCHVSYYEADAYARWMALHEPGTVLPTEQQWEHAAAHGDHPRTPGRFADTGVFEPSAVVGVAEGETGFTGWAGDAWEWTSSSYAAYPGYAAAPGALGEYNGKFMVGQQVLRGGSCATPSSHLRPTYRNFWSPATRWQYAGVRLAGRKPMNDACPAG